MSRNGWLKIGLAVAVITAGCWQAVGKSAVEAGGPKTSALDAKLPAYQKVEGEVSGSIKGVGSDTMIIVMESWCQEFKKIYPNAQYEVEGKGSATAPPALIEGSSNFGPMSRGWNEKETASFESKFGYKPTSLKTSIDMLAVYVHKDNPIEGLTFQQIDAIFSKSRKGGANNDIVTWGDLGLTGEWKDKPISLYGRNSASGTYAYFKEHALFKGDFKDTVKEQPGSSTVVQSVANDIYGIGYSGIGYKTAGVRAVPLALKEGASFVPAEPENAYSGKYPLARFLYLSVNYKPDSELDPLRREFIKFVLSREGQEQVGKEGYLPLPAKVAAKELKVVGLAAPDTENASR